MKFFKILITFSLIFGFLCLNSFTQFKFKDRTFQMGVQGTSDFGGHGAAWWRKNLYVKNVGSKNPNVANNYFIYYENRFINEANIRGVDDVNPVGTHGAIFAGPYLFSTTTPGDFGMGYNHLYRDDGSGFFENVSYMLYQEESSAPRGVAAFRFGKDLGFFTSNALPYPFPFINYLLTPREVKNFFIFNGEQYMNEFRGIYFTGFVQGVACADMDGEGQDIIEARWYPHTAIYLNDGNNYFYEADLGLIKNKGVKDNGPSPGDINNDARMDLAVVGSGKVIIYKNTGNKEAGKLFKVHQVLRVPEGCRGGFDVRFGDFNHDGWLDIFWNGVGFYENYESNGQRFFRRVTDSELMLALKRVFGMLDPRGAALGDPDGDGDLDLYATNKKGYNVLLINEINNSDWIQVVILRDDAGLFGGLGVKVYLYKAGHIGQKAYLRGYREIIGEYGYLGQDMTAAHFGAPSKGGARYDLRIVFIDGTVRDIENIKPGQLIDVNYGYALTIEASEGGTTDPEPGMYLYNEETQVDVKAIAYEDFAFSHWTIGEIKVYDNPVILIVGTDKVIKANFKKASPPANFKAQRVLTSATSLINVLTWEPNPDNEVINIAYYKIYQLQDDDRWPFIWLENVAADTFRYWIIRDPLNYSIKKDKKYEYAISSVTENGFESEKAYSIIKPGEITEGGVGKKISKVRR